jgi:hypothetical protein
MKHFTFLFAIFLTALMANAQNKTIMQEKAEIAFAKYSLMSKKTATFSQHIHFRANQEHILKNAAAAMKLDSTVSRGWVTETEEWLNEWKDEFHYDSEMKNTLWVEKDWNDEAGTWDTFGRMEMEFNNEGNVSSILVFYRDLNSGELVRENKIEAYYNAGLQLDSVLHYIAGLDETWVLETKQFYHYDEALRIIQMDMWMIEEEEGEEIVTTMSFIYSYNASGMIESISLYFAFEDEDILFSKTEYFYNDSGKISAIENSELNFSTFMLEKSSRTEYEYNTNGDVSTDIYFTRSEESGEWIPNEKDEYTYGNTSFSEVVFPTYIHLYGVNEGSYNFSKIITEINTYEITDGEWDIYGKTSFYYSSGTSTTAELTGQLIPVVYPNPATDAITFRWNRENELLTLEIYQITGARILEKTAISGVSVPISQLENGVYIYKLHNGQQTTHSGKLIKK